MTQGIKSSKGTVTIESYQGRLRLRLPRSLYNGDQRRIVLGLMDTEENRVIAEPYRAECERDIKLDMFDWTHKKYKPGSRLTVVEGINSKTVPKLNELWNKFVEYKRPQCSPNTMKTMYGQYTAYLKRLPSHKLEDAPQIRDWCVANLPLESAKRFITRLNACCNWAIESKLITSNPFYGMAGKIKPPKSQRKTEEDDINPFTAEERDLIVDALRTDRFNPKKSAYKHSHYADLIEFLFRTGCRTNEVLALQWKHIDDELRHIIFEQALIDGYEGREIREGLKTQERRRFRCNESLKSFLRSIKPEGCNPNDLVFPGLKGGFLDFAAFRRNVWKKVIEGLEVEYRKPYQTRHTFITLALENGMNVKDLATAVGNSPEVIFRHYAGSKRDIVIPEF